MQQRRLHVILLFISLLLLAGISLGTSSYATQANAAPEGSASFEQQVLEIVNQERWNNGQLPPYKGVNLLDDAAETHSTNMAVRDFFAHCDFDTHTSHSDRMQQAGYTNANNSGENIAAGYSTPAIVMTGWMNSSGHRANILSGDYREIGIGYFLQSSDQDNIRSDANSNCQPTSFDNGPYRNYWTQVFGRRNNVMPVVINREAYETTTREVDLYMYGSGWATSMRFRNQGGSWSGWQPYSENSNWTLSSGNGIKTVEAEISSGSNGAGTVRSASDTILLNELFTGPELSTAPNMLLFVGNSADNPTTMMNTLTIMNAGDEEMTWSLSENPNASWLSASATNGTLTAGAATAVTITADFSGLTIGVYETDLIIDAGSVANSPQTIPVTTLYTDQPPVFLPIVVK